MENTKYLRLQVAELEEQLAELEHLLETAENEEQVRAFKAARYTKLRQKFDVLLEIFEHDHNGN